MWRRDVAEAQIESERLPIDVRFELRMLRQSLQLRTEQKRASRSLPAVIERLLANAVAGKNQITLAPIP